MRRVVALTFVLAAFVACGSDKPKDTSGGETFTSEATTTTMVKVDEDGGREEPTVYADSGDYVNGLHIAKLTAFDESTVSFDVVQFLTGEAAEKAYREDTGETLDSDFYVRNQNPLVRHLPFGDNLVIRVNNAGGYPPNDPDKGHEVNITTLKSYFDAGPAKDGLFWLTIKDGAVTAVEEQFTP